MSVMRLKLSAFLDRLSGLDRRVVFVLLAAALVYAVCRPPRLPVSAIDSQTRKVYELVQSLPEQSFILVAAELDPANAPELYPQAQALLRHAFDKNQRVAVLYFSASAAGVVEGLLRELAREYPGKRYGEDYVLLPFMPDYAAALTQMGTDFYGIYDKDSSGRDLRGLPVMRGVSKLADVNLAVVFSATTMLDNWVALASDRFGFRLAGGVTAVVQPRYGPYLQTGQLAGLIGGMKGSADYEALLGKLDGGAAGLDALNIANFLALGLILLANAALWLRRVL
ncbi:MAG TPA: hypothetical protein PLL10_06860 [Elusimicrobiales bacterium]|nr:hypothetical protein [Elusimicrobiales bacterium]